MKSGSNKQRGDAPDLSHVRWWHWILVYVISWLVAFGVWLGSGKVMPFEKEAVTPAYAAWHATTWLIGMTVLMFIFRGIDRFKSRDRRIARPKSEDQ